MSQDLALPIDFAYWTSSCTGYVFLNEDWWAATLPPLRFKTQEEQKMVVETVDIAVFGGLAQYCIEGDWVHFSCETILVENEFLYVAGDFNEWKGIKKHLQLQLQEDGVYRVSVPVAEVFAHGDEVVFKFVTSKGRWLPVDSTAPNLVPDSGGTMNYRALRRRSGRHLLRFRLADSSYHACGDEQVGWQEASVEQWVPLDLNENFLALHTDLPLGSCVEGSSTVFRVFAPRADSVRLQLFRDLNEPGQAVWYDLAKETTATWWVQVDEDCSGSFYWYYVNGRNINGTTHFDGQFPLADPWAKALAAPKGPAVVVPAERFARNPHFFHPPAWHDLVIMEAHVRDLTALAQLSTPPEQRQGFAALTEFIRQEGNYLKNLGVNAVELQPIQENDAANAEEYHWGYMTTNYFAPASTYATDAAAASQIEEFREMVAAFHDAGLAVILDVVYNHVGEPNFLLFLDKYYFFTLSEQKHLMNWSGCGNDLRCDSPVAKALIIDSLRHLVEAYDVDGFRFDLAELIGEEVLIDIEQALKAVKPSIILIAEPWSFRGHIAEQLRSTGYASWNDGYRDTLRDYVLGKSNSDALAYFLKGSANLAAWPAQSLNYTQSHDDFAWIDRITTRRNHRGDRPTAEDRRRTHLMFAALFCSIGIPMLASGQDFMHSKSGVHNTYQRGDLNALDYQRCQWLSASHQYVSDWIALRLSDYGRALRLADPVQEGYFVQCSDEGSSATCLFYNADGQLDAYPLCFAINPHKHPASIAVDEALGQDTYQLFADTERCGLQPLEKEYFVRKEGRLHLPAMTCGFWVKLG